MNRTGPITVRPDGELSHRREVLVPLMSPMTMRENLLFEMHAYQAVSAFHSMPPRPSGQSLRFLLAQPRDDVHAITAEVDNCILAVNEQLQV